MWGEDLYEANTLIPSDLARLLNMQVPLARARPSSLESENFRDFIKRKQQYLAAAKQQDATNYLDYQKRTTACLKPFKAIIDILAANLVPEGHIDTIGHELQHEIELVTQALELVSSFIQTNNTAEVALKKEQIHLKKQAADDCVAVA
jgi:hypothetical protein